MGPGTPRIPRSPAFRQNIANNEVFHQLRYIIRRCAKLQYLYGTGNAARSPVLGVPPKYRKHSGITQFRISNDMIIPGSIYTLQ